MKVSRYVAVLLERDNQYLITQRSMNSKWAPGLWQMPGGNVEADETCLQAAVREIAEEVGVTVDPQDLRFVAMVDYRNGSGDDGVTAVFVSSVWSGDVANMEPDKCSALQWVRSDSLPQDIVDHASAIIRNNAAPRYIIVDNDKVIYES